MPFDPSKITLKAEEKAFIQWYDARCKRILSNRMVLAHLLKATMAEFADLEPEKIAAHYIEGLPGKENHSLRIKGLRNERNDPNRNANFFDVIFYALDPKTENPIPIFINVESQSDFEPNYDLCNRGIFYIGCMIADQKDTILEKSNYDDLRKVCSIWICTDPPRELANTISRYSLEQHNILGQCPPHPVDKLQLVMVHLGSEEDDNYTGVIPLLEACLSKKTNKEHQRQTTERFKVTLEQEDCDMTAGEQIIYKYKREILESEEKAKEEEKKRIAKSLKDLKVAVDTIVKSTGLTLEQIEAL